MVFLPAVWNSRVVKCPGKNILQKRFQAEASRVYFKHLGSCCFLLGSSIPFVFSRRSQQAGWRKNQAVNQIGSQVASQCRESDEDPVKWMMEAEKCLCVCTGACGCVHACVHACVCTGACMYKCVYACIVYLGICVCEYICACSCVYACMCVYLSMCVCKCIHVCVCVHVR